MSFTEISSTHSLTDLVSFIVISCDRYQPCWEPFFHGVWKYWPDCPFRIYLVSNKLTYPDQRVKAIQIGKDRTWSQNLLIALDHIPSPYAITIPEDAWLRAPVNTSTIIDYIKIMHQGRADYIRLKPCPPPDLPCPWDWRLGTLDTNASYRTSCQMPIWRLSVLRQLLRSEETAWQFEINGTERSQIYADRFLCERKPGAQEDKSQFAAINYVNSAVIKGHWTQEAKLYAKDEGLVVDFQDRNLRGWTIEFLSNHPLLEKIIYKLKRGKKFFTHYF